MKKITVRRKTKNLYTCENMPLGSWGIINDFNGDENCSYVGSLIYCDDDRECHFINREKPSKLSNRWYNIRLVDMIEFVVEEKC